MEYVTLAKVVSTHGIKGDLKLFPLTDFAKIRFKKGKKFELYNEDLSTTMEQLKEYVDSKESEDIYNKIISVINKYTFEEDKTKVIDLIKYDLKNTKLTKKTFEVTCFSFKTSGKFIVVHFDEFNTPEEAIKYQNYIIRMNSEEVHRLPKDTYYYKDLIGSTVYLENGDKYGEVISVTNNGKQDLLRIKMANNKETLIVFVNALIKEVDIKNKSIILNDIEGL